MKNHNSLKSALLAISLAFTSALAAKEASSFSVEVSGSGKPLIFIPGLACPGEVWQEVVARYESNYECHVVSLAGFGGSSPTELNDAFLETVTEDLFEYIEANELHKPVIVGHSLGGFLGLKMGIQDSDALEGLFIVDSLPFLPAGMNPSATPESMKQFAESQREMTRHGTMPEPQARMMLNSMITDPANIEKALVWVTQSDSTTVAQAMYEMNTIDLRENVSKISVPTQVLGTWIAYKQFGSTRESTEAIFKAQYEKLLNCRIELTDHARHFIMWDDPDFFFSQLDGFLNLKS